MIKTQDVLNDLDIIDREKFKSMIQQVNIPDFVKCVSAFSGISIGELSDSQLIDYIITWANNKYEMWKMLGENIHKDFPFEYERQDNAEEIQNDIYALGKDYPAYSLWLLAFQNCRENKIKDIYDILATERDNIETLFPSFKIAGSTITHFFKRYLNAPDDLVTRIGTIFENNIIKATYTLSIDPVDMMLASENPYSWNSCYRLETPNECSHADGCMASVLDNATAIGYIWNREGKFKLYDNYSFKSIRYKRIRQWIAFSHKCSSIHFNAIYPGKDTYDGDFHKKIRLIVEGLVSDYYGYEDSWKRNNKGIHAQRRLYYGYDEYSEEEIYYNTTVPIEEYIEVFNEPIECACGCGYVLPGSDLDEYDDGYAEYNGHGFNCNNFTELLYCEYTEGERCVQGISMNGECMCRKCDVYCDAHPYCGLEEGQEEEIECDFFGCDDVENGVVRCSEEHCSECEYYKEHCCADPD